MVYGLGQLSVGIVFILVTDKYWNEQSKHLETLEKFGRKMFVDCNKFHLFGDKFYYIWQKMAWEKQNKRNTGHSLQRVREALV